jgi:hypothetical protein
VAIPRIVRTCLCGKHAAKYLKDNITTVVTEGSIVFGIDNVSFFNAMKRTDMFQNHEKYKDQRIDSFFCGWIPSVPGEVIFVKSPIHVKAYDYWSSYNHDSTNPTTDYAENVRVSNG